MARPRIELQSLLESLLGTRNVYFQPKPNFEMKYPAIVYSRDKNLDEYANDSRYKKLRSYQVTVIDRNPDSLIPDSLEDQPYTELGTIFQIDGLNHFVFNMYF